MNCNICNGCELGKKLEIPNEQVFDALEKIHLEQYSKISVHAAKIIFMSIEKPLQKEIGFDKI